MALGFAAAALVVLAQLVAAPQPYRSGVKVHFYAAQPISPKEAPMLGRVVIHPAPQMLCTMPMLRPQGNVDPKIVVEPPKNGAKIRTIDAPKCIERASR